VQTEWEGAALAETVGSADAVLLFVQDSAELSAKAGPFLDASRRDALAYIAYPKAGKLGADLNRDILWQDMAKECAGCTADLVR